MAIIVRDTLEMTLGVLLTVAAMMSIAVMMSFVILLIGAAIMTLALVSLA